MHPQRITSIIRNPPEREIKSNASEGQFPMASAHLDVGFQQEITLIPIILLGYFWRILTLSLTLSLSGISVLLKDIRSDFQAQLAHCLVYVAYPTLAQKAKKHDAEHKKNHLSKIKSKDLIWHSTTHTFKHVRSTYTFTSAIYKSFNELTNAKHWLYH